jgi:cytochrome c oxidase subunit 2
VPIGRRVKLELTSADVAHSFWVPQLTYKTDLIPGRTNVTWFQAQRPGTYQDAFRGQCAEYCGLQHATMAFLVVAEPEATYDAWVATQQRPATAVAPPGSAAARGLAVLERDSCASCHTLRGTSAAGGVGPDLTHFGSRRTLGAGAAPNTRGYLGGWIIDAQNLKPGNRMPSQPLEPQELQDVLAYFDSQRQEAAR